MGPVFSAAFIIPLIIGVNAAGKGAGRRRRSSVLLAAVGVFALGWIVAQYAKRIHAAGSLYDYVSNGLGKDDRRRRRAGSTTAARIILTVGLGVLIGGYVHDNLLPTCRASTSPLPMWAWGADLRARCCSSSCTSACRSRPACSSTLALISIAVVLDLLRHGDHRARGRQRRREGVQPVAGGRVVGDPVRGAVRRADLRRVRDRGQPGRGDRRAEARDPAGGARCRGDRRRSST